jgi:hypothetical protein
MAKAKKSKKYIWTAYRVGGDRWNVRSKGKLIELTDMTQEAAHLIAAAPDLYAAAKAMLAHLDWWLQDEATNIADADASKKLYEQLTAAVAKAEGRVTE